MRVLMEEEILNKLICFPLFTYQVNDIVRKKHNFIAIIDEIHDIFFWNPFLSCLPLNLSKSLSETLSPVPENHHAKRTVLLLRTHRNV